MAKYDEQDSQTGTVIELSDRVHPLHNDAVGVAINSLNPDLDALLERLSVLQKCVADLEDDESISEADQLVLLLVTTRISAAVGAFSDVLTRVRQPPPPQRPARST